MPTTGLLSTFLFQIPSVQPLHVLWLVWRYCNIIFSVGDTDNRPSIHISIPDTQCTAPTCITVSIVLLWYYIWCGEIPTVGLLPTFLSQIPGVQPIHVLGWVWCYCNIIFGVGRYRQPAFYPHFYPRYPVYNPYMYYGEYGVILYLVWGIPTTGLPPTFLSKIPGVQPIHVLGWVWCYCNIIFGVGRYRQPAFYPHFYPRYPVYNPYMYYGEYGVIVILYLVWGDTDNRPSIRISTPDTQYTIHTCIMVSMVLL